MQNGAEAIEALGARTFDLVFMDMQMPVLDGLEATRRLRGMGVSVPIVGLTANAFTSDREACLSAGMDAFVAKPLTRAKLVDVLDGFLRAADPAAPAAAAPPSADEATDEGYRAAIIAEIGLELFDDLLAEFTRDGVALAEQARRAFAEGERAAADHALHSIKGAALTLGLVGIAALAQQCRTEANPGADIATLAAMIGALRAEGERRVA